jgi:hypothetical protein
MDVPASPGRGPAKWDKQRHIAPRWATVMPAKTQQAQAPGTTLSACGGSRVRGSAALAGEPRPF